LAAADVPVFALRREAGFRPGVGRQIAALAAAHQVDVIHCHQYTPFVYGRVAALLRPRLRVVYTEHGRLSDAPPSRKRRLVNPVLSRFPGPIVAVSEDLRRYLVTSGFPARRVGIVYNGIAPGERPSTARRERARRSLGLSSTCLAVGTAARLDPVKDLTVLIEAFGRLFKSDPDRRLVIIGDGPERVRLERCAQENRCVEATLFTGHRDDARELMAALDVYVNTSITEGMSVTILEAMAAGVPVVATRVGGNPELVEEGVTGRLVPAHDAAALADAVDRLSGSDVERATMGRAARSRLEERFTVDRMVGEYFMAYGLAGRT
jgi:glycosyltransferase involved in cell wall biosynthesis